MSPSVLRLEDVREVGVPETDAAEADARGLGAAVADVEEAPLPAVVRLRGTGSRPVETEHVHVLNVTVWRGACSRLV